jgi:hypothetical protein
LHVDRGYRPESVTTARVLLSGYAAPAAERAAALNAVLDRFASMPNVAAVGASEGLPTTKPRAGVASIAMRKDGTVVDLVSAHVRRVSPGYFAALGVRIEGRGFDRTDTLQSEPVSIVNRTYANTFMKNKGLNDRIPIGPDPDRRRGERSVVVGIVDDIRQTATETVRPEVYLCICQVAAGPLPMQFIVVRTIGGAQPATSTVHRLVRDAAPGAVVDQVRTLEATVRSDISKPRLYAVVLSGFGVFALLVAVVGLYSGLSYGVTQRTQEIGVRAALGATPRDIVGLILRQGAAMTLSGMAIGFGVAASTGRYLASFLFGVTPADPATFVSVGVAVTAIAAVACGIPARRAAKVDPIDALRR